MSRGRLLVTEDTATAVVSDILETVLQVKNVTAYVAGMSLAANTVRALAAGEIAAAEASVLFRTALASAIPGLTAAAAVLGTVTAGVVFLRGSIKQFGEDEQVWIRLARALHNTGSAVPLKEIQDYATARLNATGVDDEATAALVAQLIQLRFTTEQWKALVPALQEAEAAHLGTTAEMARSIQRFLVTGQPRSLLGLGFLDIPKIQHSADKVAEIVRQMMGRAGGSIDDFHNSLQGAFDAMGNQADQLKSSIGDILAPYIIFQLQFYTSWIRYLGEQLEKRTGVPRQSTIDAERIARTAQQKGFGQEDSDNLGKIAKNTQQTADAIVRQAFGGPGTIGKAALNFRSARAAIRGGAG